MYSWNDLKPWIKFIMEGDPYEVLTYSQKVVWRWGSIINVKARNLLTGASVPKTFSDKDRFEPADVIKSSYEYLYNDTADFYFMNTSTYEQVAISADVVWDNAYFLIEGDKVALQEYNWAPINIETEISVVLEVTDTPPWEKWDTATWWKKPATLETGLVIQVPLFVNIWDKIKVDTRTKSYLSRA